MSERDTAIDPTDPDDTQGHSRLRSSEESRTEDDVQGHSRLRATEDASADVDPDDKDPGGRLP